MNREAKIVYKRIENKLKKDGFINLNHTPVKTKEDLVEISKIFRDPRYETFRMIYLNKDRIVGYESVSTKTPNSVCLFSNVRGTNKQKAEMGFYKIKNRMERLNADSYYMVHNHPSGNARASSFDIRTTKVFAKRVDGFKGHLIINENTYTWIDIDKEGTPVLDECMKLNETKAKRMQQKIMINPQIENMKIKSREDLVYLMNSIKNTKDYSTAVLTDASGFIRLILDIPDSFLNMSTSQVNGYFKNLAKQNGSTRVFFITQNEKTYRKSLTHAKKGTFKDNIYFQDDGSKLVLADASMEEKDLFDTGDDISVMEEDPKKVKILYKKVGEKSKTIVIDNLLETKQELVGGLIEVVPYMDNMLLVCNEEGKLMNLPPNVVFDLDYIAGDFFIIGDDYERGDFKSLTPEEILKAKEDIDSRSFEYKLDMLPRYECFEKKLEKDERRKDI